MRQEPRAGWPVFAALPLVWLACVFAILSAAAIAIDYTRRATAHEALEEAAGVAAHAALTTRLMLDETAARIAARAIIRRLASADIPERGAFVGSGMIDFGRWDRESGRFVIETDARGAVRVVVRGPGPARPILEPLFHRVTGQRDFGRSATIVLVADPAQCGRAPVCQADRAGGPVLALFSAR